MRHHLSHWAVCLSVIPASLGLGGPSAGPSPGSGWLTAVRRKIADSEYEVRWQNRTALPDLDAAWHAPNRAQGFRTYFTPKGIRVVPRLEAEPGWEWSLTLTGYGRGARSLAVDDGRLTVSGARVEYDRAILSEWYANSPRGLEQGFLLDAPPEKLSGEKAASATRAPRGRAGADPLRLLHLDLALGGGTAAHPSADGSAVDFLAPGGARVIHLAELRVSDAAGRGLPAWFEGYAAGEERGVRIVIDDRGATWPLAIDPLATSPTWTVESDQASARLGFSVATAGDVDGNGYDDVIVGAFQYDNGEADEGMALVYLGSPSGLSTSADWTAESDQAGANFGYSVSTAGDVNGDGYSDVIVGAYRYDGGQTDEGAAFVYLGSDLGLSATDDWTAQANQASASFGYSVSTAGDVNGDGYSDVIVGAYAFDNGETDEGRAFVYYGSASGPSTVADWTAESDQAGARLGISVATAGDTNADGYADVIAGAYFYDNGETNEGRALLWFGSASGPSLTADWTVESDQADARLGGAVATAGDVDGDGYADVIVGASLWDGGVADEGQARVYLGSTAGPATTAAWSATGGQASAAFGIAVAPAGDVNGDGYADVAVGAYLYDNGETDEGRAFVYLGSASGPASSPSWTAEADQAGARFGRSVATAGDVDGDGYSDLIVGANLYDNGQTDEGRALVYLGGASGPATSADWQRSGGQLSAAFGGAVSSAGDVNGDGYADVAVGAAQYDNGQSDEGRVFVFLGSATGLPLGYAWSAEGDQTSVGFGRTLAGAGDVNGDGFDDLVIAAPDYPVTPTLFGRVFLYAGSATGLPASPTSLIDAPADSGAFASSVAGAGDVNGDGYADLIVGDPQYSATVPGGGRAYVYLGGGTGLAATPAWFAEESVTAGAHFGASVGGGADVNADGYDDIVVGADGKDQFSGSPPASHPSAGEAQVYLGGPSGPESTSAWSTEGTHDNERLGAAVALAGDVNGDGYADVLIGSPGYDRGQLFLGAGAGVYSFSSWDHIDAQPGSELGGAVAAAGDVNGDGYADVLIGASLHDASSYTDDGRVEMYLGSASVLASSADWSVDGLQDAARLGAAVAGAGDVNGDGYAEVLAGAPDYDDGLSDEGIARLFYGNGGAGLSLRPRQRRTAYDRLIARDGAERETDGFRLAAVGHAPSGRGRARLAFKVAARSKFLADTPEQQQTSWTDTGTAGAALEEVLAGLEPGDYHWSVRLLYDPVTSPYARASRWFTIPWGGRDENDLRIATHLGGLVWEDRHGDGVRQDDEPLLGGIEVQLLDTADTVIENVLTDFDGSYRFEVDRSTGYRIRFIRPSGYLFTTKDRGIDDTRDSDADTVSGKTDDILPPHSAFDDGAWSAGLRREGPCYTPDEAVYIASVTQDANTNTVLEIQDPNQPNAVSGYNIYRSSDAALDPASWPMLASDVVDEDAGTPNVQWTDATGDVSPTGMWYYQATAYNDACDAEGPR